MRSGPALAACLTAGLAGAVAPAAQEERAPLRLWYDEPAARWEAALPVGNGRLGAMVFGGVAEERLQLNEDSIWAGAPFDRDRAGAHRFLDEARELWFAGKVVEAQELMQREFMSERIVRSYQPLGDLVLRFPGLDGERDGGRYRRSLSLEEALAEVGYGQSGAGGADVMAREVFASAADDVLVVRVRAGAPRAGSLELSLARSLGAVVRYDAAGTAILEGQAFQPELDESGHPREPAKPEGVSFACHVRVLPSATAGAPTMRATEGALHVTGFDDVTILVSAATDYRGGDPHAAASARLDAAAAKTYDRLRADHVREHRRLFGRVRLELGGEERRGLPTDERLAAVRAGALDPDLLATYFQYGRYLLLSSSRPGSLPANLQGLWNPHLEAPWNSDYHVNINCQMNYWPAEVTNLAECHEPFFTLIEGLRERGRKTARELYGARGWVAHHTTDAWWFTSPIGRTVWGLWPTGGAWCTRHMWEHYLYGGDRDFLAGRAWPVMREAAEFFLDYLVEDPATGRLVSGPSSSPENRFRTEDGQEADVCMGASMDQEIVWDLFTNVLEAARALELEADPLVERVAAARERLAWPGIGTDGRLLEWSRELEEVEPGHRHMSHLFGLHPGRQFTQAETPLHVDAARRSLEYRLAHGGGHTGWSRAWIVNVYARLLDGDAAHENLLALLRSSTLENLFDDHPPFQIDGNFGATAAIAELLLQSHDGTVHLLPALPDAWDAGSVTGLRARGGLTVDLTWQAGRLRRARLTADRSGAFSVRHGARAREVELRAGEVVELSPDDLE